ncbi:serine hydrolase domain-containing protein [Sphingomonas rubra]|uniref:CubicO group peptidase, beta-lactamase class C family n=1 Tax=Sphingomonas rubra TaxID=634430 RepID=A0A1I5S9L2_9SPHN|nr:serine hydrolase [Sphingomonas rubra]SFP67405.1 CubicO group peptidase, beta-lactamase class C family [Sphingomonas rubra]
MRRLLPLLLLLTASCEVPASAPDRSVARAATRGLDAATMRGTVATAARLPRLRALLVLRDGETLAGHVFNGGAALDRPVNIKSASKSVMSALIGIAIARGVFASVDQPILPLLRADAPADPDPRLARVTIGNLLSMQAGLERTSGEYYGRWVSTPHWVRYALSRPFVADPGTAMLYSTGSTHLLSAALTRASGRSTLANARAWLGEPLGIAIPSWPADPQGIFFGGNEMRLSPRALARFGELYRLDGVVDGRRVLPAGWVEASWTPRAVSPWSGQPYGYGWFLTEVRGHPVRFAWGYGGQMVYVVPDLRLTVVMTSDPNGARDTGHIDALHRLLADGVIRAAEIGAPSASGHPPARRSPASIRRG